MADERREIQRLEEGESVEIVAKQARKLEDLQRVFAYLALNGFEVKCELTTPTSPEELFEQHMKETYPPQDPYAYLGKEHFWKIGEEIGIRREVAGRLFTEVCFPVVDLKQRKRYKDPLIGTPLTPESIGLKVLSREEAHMSDPGIRLVAGNPTHRQQLHNEVIDSTLNPQNAVIQVQGILDLPRGRRLDDDTYEDDIAGQILTRTTLEIFPEFCRELALISDPQQRLFV